MFVKTLLMAVMLVGCAGAAPSSPANGIYAVLADGATRKDVQSTVLVYNRKYSESDRNEPPKYIALDTSSFAPLALAKPPEMTRDGRGWAMLYVTLTPAGARSLEKLTAAHLNGLVAVVIDGEIVTMHKVRSVIHDGNVQITRCGDNACETLRRKLVK